MADRNDDAHERLRAATRLGDRPMSDNDVGPCTLNGVWATLMDIIHEFAEGKYPNRHERFRLEAIASLDAYLDDPCMCADCGASGAISRLERHRAELVAECP